MAGKKRFTSITSELSLIRETHRWVLQWMSFKDGKMQEICIGLDRQALRDLSAALAQDAVSWNNEACGLRVRKRGNDLELAFGSKALGIPSLSLFLDPEQASRLADALASSAP